jgi:hypothetical protein
MVLVGAAVLFGFLFWASRRDLDSTTKLTGIAAIGLVLTAADLVIAFRTGRATGRWGGSILRKGRPALFKRWIVAQYFVVAAFAIVLVWALLRNN